jgi:hypothetical protein
MVGDTLPANKAMVGFARRTGYAVSARSDDPTLARLEKSLAPKTPGRPTQPLAA